MGVKWMTHLVSSNPIAIKHKMIKLIGGVIINTKEKYNNQLLKVIIISCMRQRKLANAVILREDKKTQKYFRKNISQ